MLQKHVKAKCTKFTKIIVLLKILSDNRKCQYLSICSFLNFKVFSSFSCENSVHPHTALLTQRIQIYNIKKAWVYMCICVEDIINWGAHLQNVLESSSKKKEATTSFVMHKSSKIRIQDILKMNSSILSARWHTWYREKKWQSLHHW